MTVQRLDGCGSAKRKSPPPFPVAGFDLLRMVGRVGFEPTTNWLKDNWDLGR